MNLQAALKRVPLSCQNGVGFKAPCPICQDHDEEPLEYRLKIREGKAAGGRLYWRLRCEGGCQEQRIMLALQLSERDRFFDVPEPDFDLSDVADVPAEDALFLFGRHIRLGQISLMDADSGVGKTTAMLALAAGLSIGFDPIGQKPMEKGKTLFFGGEDSLGNIRLVFDRLGGNPKSLVIPTVRGSDPRDPERLDVTLDAKGLALVRSAIERSGAKLVIFDPMQDHLPPVGGGKDPMNDPQTLIPILRELRKIAMDLNVAIINIRHTRKGAHLGPASEMGIGSVKIKSMHRGLFLIRFHPDRKGVRVITDEKGSLVTDRAPAFGFEYVKGAFCWAYDVDANAFDPKPGKGRRGECEESMLDLLSEGPQPSTDARDQLRAMGFKDRTIDRAKDAIGVISRQRGKHHYWLLPSHLEKWEAEQYNPYEDQ